MSQTTFTDKGRWRSLDQLTEKQLRIVRLLREGLTQATISRRLRISRASVNQTVKLLESQNLIKKEVGTNYNVIYSVAPQLQKRIGGVQEQVSPVRTHNIAMKYHILSQDRPFSHDTRNGYQKKWKMRGWEAATFWFDGDAGGQSFTVTTYPKTIKIQMDAGQKIIAKDHFDAENKGFQQISQVRQKFIDSQRLFGVNIEIEPTGTRMGKPHGGLAFHEGGPLDSETRIPGTWVDGSATKELGPGYKEFEMHTDHSLLTPLEKGVLAVAGMPDMFRDIINPIGAEVTAVKAMMMGEVTMQRQYEAMMKFMTAAMTEIQTLRKEVSELKRQS